jgi:hypothetical protein
VLTQFPDPIPGRTGTGDIDGAVIGIADPANSHEYLIFKNAIHGVAHDRKLAHNWVSDNIADYLAIVGLPPLKLWRRFGPLEIYVPPADYIFVLKMLADRGKDQADILYLIHHLGLTSRAQAMAIIKKYVKHPDKEIAKQLDSTIHRYFKH